MSVKNGLFFLLFGLLPGIGYQAIQERWRLAFADASESIVYLLGVAPNALGAVSMAAGLFVIGHHFLPKATYAQLASYSVLTSLFGLMLWELVQLWLPNGTFDVHDLIWTAVGALFAWIMTRLWYFREWETAVSPTTT
ncbi:MAG: hypothetical protein R3D55_27925 [Chloroflexota bacterium]